MRRFSAVAVTFLVAVFASIALSAGQEPPKVIGAGVTDLEATTIADLYRVPDTFVGKRVRVEGVVTAVCEEMGCWMALAPEGDETKTVRLKADHDGALIFPVTARGRRASAEGVFEKIGAEDTEARNAAAEQAAATGASDFNATYQIKAAGAVIR